MNNRLEMPTTEHEVSDLIRWKTGAWQDPGMVNWYSGRMVQSESTNSLKNAVEVGTIRRFVPFDFIIPPRTSATCFADM